MERQIMIVTRDAQFRDALKRVCSGQGCRVEMANSVATASEIAGRKPVCVLVADATLQNASDGLELARSIHQQDQDAKCFLIVDEDCTDVSETAETEPWLSLVKKPIHMLSFIADLADAIHKC